MIQTYDGFTAASFLVKFNTITKKFKVNIMEDFHEMMENFQKVTGATLDACEFLLDGDTEWVPWSTFSTWLDAVPYEKDLL